MTRSRWTRIAMASAFGLAVTATVTRADLFRDVAYGLGYAGFNLEGDRNILSGGADFRISRDLVGNTLDFGLADLTLAGPISLEFSTGERGLSTLDISLQTAMTSNQASSPLSYVLNYDVGGQSAEIAGNILIDANFSLNGFGFYDLELMYSSRQDVERDGRFSDSEDAYDFDIGPINVSGNLFADALALITAPFFEGTGQFNPFESFSGRAQVQKLIEASTEQAREQLAAGANPVDKTLPLGAFLPIATEPSTGALSIPASQGNAGPDGVVPEPPVLILLLLGIPLLTSRRLRAFSR